MRSIKIHELVTDIQNCQSDKLSTLVGGLLALKTVKDVLFSGEHLFIY